MATPTNKTVNVKAVPASGLQNVLDEGGKCEPRLEVVGRVLMLR